MAELTDFSIYSMRGSGGGGNGGGEKKPEYTGTLHENVRQLLEALRTDPRFSKVDSRILNEIIDTAIDTATRIGTHAKAVGARTGFMAGGVVVAGGIMTGGIAFLPLAPLLFPIAFGLITVMSKVNITERDRTRAKSQLYEETVKRLLRYNKMPVVDQRAEFAGLSRRSAVRDFMPPVVPPSLPVAPSSGQQQSSMANLLFNLSRPASSEDGAAAPAPAAGAGAGAYAGSNAGANGLPGNQAANDGDGLGGQAQPTNDDLLAQLPESLRKKIKKKFDPVPRP